MMNPDIKAEWQRRLRSGYYKQGRGKLYDPRDDAYCCLGVLCRIAEEAGIVQFDTSMEYGGRVRGTANRQDYSEGVLPLAVMTWAELPNVNPYIPSSGYSLATHNDSGDSFGIIADLVGEL